MGVTCGGGGASIKFAKTGRTIDPEGSTLNFFLYPMLAWGVITIASFTLSFVQFEQTDSPMRSLGVAATVELLATTARFYANDLVMAGTAHHIPLGNRSDAEERLYLRARLHNTTEEMFALYESLLLGGGPFHLTGSLYHSPAHEPLLFDHTCLRLVSVHHTPPCVDFGHSHYYRTMFGLDNLIKHYREECVLMALEPDSALGTNNTRYQFIWDAGKYDLRGGLQTNTRIYLEDVQAPPARDQVIQICVLVLVLVAMVYFVRNIFLPWFQATNTEVHRIAELLAQLPAEIDMHAVISEHLLMGQEDELQGVVDHED